MSDPSSDVFAAQRAYGAYLRPGPQQQSALADARSRYQVLLERASAEPVVRHELVRLLRETKTVADLRLDPVEILGTVPPEERELAFEPAVLSADQLSRLATLWREPYWQSRLADGSFTAAVREGRNDLLRAAAEQPGELAPIAEAHLLGIHPNAIAAMASPPPGSPEQWLTVTGAALATGNGWLERESTAARNEPFRASVAAALGALAQARLKVETVFVRQAIDQRFITAPGDLRSWKASMEHLRRRAVRCLSDAEEIGLSVQHPELQALEHQRRRLVDHAADWGNGYATRYSVLQWNRSDGPTVTSCPCCGTWLRDRTTAKHCGQCGLPLDAEPAATPSNPLGPAMAPPTPTPVGPAPHTRTHPEQLDAVRRAAQSGIPRSRVAAAMGLPIAAVQALADEAGVRLPLP